MLLHPNQARLAVTLVGGVVRLREIVRDGRALLVRYGRELIENAWRIDVAVPQAVMLDVQNVGPVS